MEKELIKKAYKCGSCALFDYKERHCTTVKPYGDKEISEFDETDDFGNIICKHHKSRKDNSLTGGYYFQKPKERQKIYFVGDLHFGHVNIMKHHPIRMEKCNVTSEELENDSKFAIEKHDKWLIELWNNTVKKEDSVYILGDFCLQNKEYTEKILKQLKGKKYFIKGNHDKSIKGLENYFECVEDIKEVKFTNNQFKFIDENETFCLELCHYPMLTWNRRPHGSINICGHCHGSLDKYNTESNELRVDVGLDGNLCNYHFIELEELYNYFCKIKNNYGCKTFQQFIDKRMEELGYRA